MKKKTKISCISLSQQDQQFARQMCEEIQTIHTTSWLHGRYMNKNFHSPKRHPLHLPQDSTSRISQLYHLNISLTFTFRVLNLSTIMDLVLVTSFVTDNKTPLYGIRWMFFTESHRSLRFKIRQPIRFGKLKYGATIMKALDHNVP
jgi:hypothetical protein